MIKKPKILITGWFSFDLPYNTAGDLLAAETATKWVIEADFDYDLAVPNPCTEKEVNANKVEAEGYVAVVFVCGPLTSRHLVPFIQRFNRIKKIALNVSIVATHNLISEFDVIIPRDAPGISNPDISLATNPSKTPVVGLIYVGAQKEYPTQQHALVEKLVEEVTTEMDLAIVKIDTKIPSNEYGLKSIAQIESVMKAMDIVITTRLHGSLLALRNGVPVVSIDPVPEGAKVITQMKAVGWKLAYTIGELTKEKLIEAIRTALLEASKNKAKEVITSAKDGLLGVKEHFQEALKNKL